MIEDKFRWYKRYWTKFYVVPASKRADSVGKEEEEDREERKEKI